MGKEETSMQLLNQAYKCKAANLEALLEKIEFAIKNSNNVDKVLLEAKLVVTSKIAVNNRK